jgi:DNA-binding beta-propeller fold protein YncE
MNSSWMRRPLAIIVILTAGFSAPIQAQTRSAGLLNFSSDGSRVACSNRDSGTVTILRWPELKVQHEISVGSHPEGVAWIGTTHKLACCVYGDDEIVILDADSGSVEQRIGVFDEPYGIVSSQDGTITLRDAGIPRSGDSAGCRGGQCVGNMGRRAVSAWTRHQS